MEIEPAGRNVLEMQTGIRKIFGDYKSHAASSVPYFCTHLSFDSSLGHEWIIPPKKNLHIFLIAYLQDNPFYPSRLRRWRGWKQIYWEGLEDTGGWKARHDPSMCIHSPEKQLYPGLHKRRHGMAGQERWFCLSAFVCWNPTVFSSGAGPEEGHKNDRGDGTPLLGRKAERVWIVHPGDKKALWTPYWDLLYLKRSYKMVTDILIGPTARGQGVLN